MAVFSLIPQHARASFFAIVFATLAIALLNVSKAGAQLQEGGTLSRIINPDRSLHYDGSDKQFNATSSVVGHQATVRPYVFGQSSSAVLRTGDGAFSTRAFQGKDKFRANEYATHPANAGNQGFAQKEKTFGTKTMDVREDRAANKALPVREYTPGEKPFLERGKRQDTIDELRKQKNLTIDQVRELLNKNK